MDVPFFEHLLVGETSKERNIPENTGKVSQLTLFALEVLEVF